MRHAQLEAGWARCIRAPKSACYMVYVGRLHHGNETVCNISVHKFDRVRL